MQVFTAASVSASADRLTLTTPAGFTAVAAAGDVILFGYCADLGGVVANPVSAPDASAVSLADPQLGPDNSMLVAGFRLTLAGAPAATYEMIDSRGTQECRAVMICLHMEAGETLHGFAATTDVDAGAGVVLDFNDMEVSGATDGALAIFAFHDDIATVSSAPSGMTEVTGSGAGSALTGYSYYQLAVGSGPQSRSLTWSAVEQSGGIGVLVGITTAAAPAPTISSIDPVTGDTTGGTPCTLTGTGFVDGATVAFDGEAATSVTFVSATEITCVSPAHAAGAVDVVITNPDTQTGTLAGGFTYVTPPAGPTIDTQPVADTVLINGDPARASASFTVAATGTGTLSYQWELETSVAGGVYANVASGDGATWAGATTTNLTGTFTVKTLTGRRVRCVATDDNGSTTSNAVALTVYTGPVLSSSSGTTNASGVSTVGITSDYPNADGEFTVVTATAGGLSKQVSLHYETAP